MVTLDGTIADEGTELESETTAPPEGAGPVKVTAPVTAVPPIFVGGTVTLLNVRAPGLTVTLKVELTPEYEAVSTTGVEVATDAPPIVKEVELEPCGIVTVGSVTSVGDALSPIAAPPAGAGPVSASVQVDVAGGVIVNGLHENPFIPGGVMVTVEPVADTGRADPPASEAPPLVRLRDDDESVVDPETTRETVATVPALIVVASGPASRQVTVPAFEMQLTDLFAAIAAEPALTETEVKSVAE